MSTTGKKAPEFSLPDSEGQTVRLKDFRGKKVVLYFYPKDQTPGCTKEACSFNDSLAEYRKRGAVVLGVSADSVESHSKFSRAYGLTFPLLSDGEKKVIKAYGVWKKKSLYGREFMGIERTTFVIDEQGIIRAVFPRVRVDGHAEAVLNVLDGLEKIP
ncbi:MAG: thioredoxin-dependent thiol peroxidase [Ignavibacteriales bacterium]|nr:thioredoxin-dependent thiol peroxidase [Ignavibacteriales bacterium]